MKSKVLLTLHLPPPKHGASKVGEFIKNSKKINASINAQYVPIVSSSSIGEIGKFNLKKIFHMFNLYFKLKQKIKTFKPQKIYYTASTGKIAFIRDYIATSVFRRNKNLDVYYHYHTKGLEGIKKNFITKAMLKSFLKNSNLILLSPLLKKEFDEFEYKNVYYLPNGVEDIFENEEEFNQTLKKRLSNKKIRVFYMSNMIKSKGYFKVLELARKFRDIEFHFAGGWQSGEDEKEFFDFVEKHNLKNVVFHGFVGGERKKELLKNSHAFIFPTKYKNEAFPLSVLEALSAGVAVFTTDEGSLPSIIDDKSGVVLKNFDNFEKEFDFFIKNYVNEETSRYCRRRYLDNFTLKRFEENFIKIINGEKNESYGV